MQHHNDEVSIKELMFRIKQFILYYVSKWKLVLVISILGFVIGFAYSFRQETTYTASISFALEEERNSTGGGISLIASQFGIDPGSGNSGAFSSQNLLTLIKSRTIFEKTLMRQVSAKNQIMSLLEYYLLISNEGDSLSDHIKKNVLNPDLHFREKDSLIGGIYSRFISPKNKFFTISVKDKRTSIITIEINFKDELFSKLLAENLVNQVSEFYTEFKTQRAKINYDILQRQTDSVRTELYKALEGVAAGNDRAFNLNPALNIIKLPTSKRQVDVQANTAMLTQLIQNLELAKVSLRKEAPFLQIIDKPVFPLPINKVSKRNSSIAGVIVFNFLFFIGLGIIFFIKKQSV